MNQQRSSRRLTSRIMMLCGLLAALPFGLTTKPALAAAPAMSGKWTVHRSIGGNDSDWECTFTQTEKELTGTCETDKDPSKVTGTIDGSKVTWKYDVDYNGSLVTLVYSATVDDPAKISGSVEAQPFGVTGHFTAVPSK